MKFFSYVFFLCFSICFGKITPYDAGVRAYENRAVNAVGIVAQPDSINRAIIEFKKAEKNSETELNTGIYLLRCYYFKGKFVANTDNEKKAVFNEGKELAESMLELYPESAAVRYWYLANLGSWAEVYGILTAAKEGVADLMKEHSEKIIELDPDYWDGGGYFMLGAVHYKSPYIPFLLSWPDNDTAIQYLTLAMNTGKPTPHQMVYLARALYKDDNEDEAKTLLNDLIRSTISKDEPVEDLEQLKIAKEILDDWN